MIGQWWKKRLRKKHRLMSSFAQRERLFLNQIEVLQSPVGYRGRPDNRELISALQDQLREIDKILQGGGRE